jgi:hypothetical protein
MTAKDIAAIRTYLRVWVFAPEFDGNGVEALRQTVDELASREAIEDWLAAARKEWVSPLWRLARAVLWCVPEGDHRRSRQAAVGAVTDSATITHPERILVVAPAFAGARAASHRRTREPRCSDRACRSVRTQLRASGRENPRVRAFSLTALKRGFRHFEPLLGRLYPEPCRQLTLPTTSSPRKRRPSDASSRRTDFLAPRALIRCARR